MAVLVALLASLVLFGGLGALGVDALAPANESRRSLCAPCPFASRASLLADGGTPWNPPPQQPRSTRSPNNAQGAFFEVHTQALTHKPQYRGGVQPLGAPR